MRNVPLPTKVQAPSLVWHCALPRAVSVVMLALVSVASASAQGVPEAKIRERPPGLAADTPLDKIYGIEKFFSDPRNAPVMQFANEKTDYAWQNMSRFYNVAMLLRDGPISELPVRTDSSMNGLRFKHPVLGEETVKRHFETTTMDAMIVIHRGSVVYEKYKTMRPFDKHNWYSTGKTIAGMSIALLEDEGKVDIARPVSEYLTELKGSVWDTVTVEQTLDMATGLDSNEIDTPNARTDPKNGWFRWAVSLGIFVNPNGPQQSTTEVYRSMQRLKPGFTVFEYNSMNTHLLQLIVERVTGKTLNEFFADRVWRKMGAESDGFFGVTRDGHPMSWGFTSSSLRDLARWGTLFTPSWNKIAKERVIPSGVLERIQHGGNRDIYLKGAVGKMLQASFPGVTGLSEHYQWDAVFPDGDFLKLGVGGQGLYVSPAHDAIVAWFSTGEHQEEAMARAIVQQLSPHR